jgi:hypothetical protein
VARLALRHSVDNRTARRTWFVLFFIVGPTVNRPAVGWALERRVRRSGRFEKLLMNGSKSDGRMHV